MTLDPKTLKDKSTTVKTKLADVVDHKGATAWVYTDTVKDHFFKPRNLLLTSPGSKDYDDLGKLGADGGLGMVGSPACGDYMKMWIKVDRQTDRLTDLKWQTFGCGSAIASTSMLSVMATENGGLKIDEALKIKPQDIMERLGGLPARKIHCSVLGDKALRSAVNDYFRRSGQKDRIEQEESRIIDHATQTTDKDIEEVVLDGATTLEQVQEKLKVAVGADSATRLEVEQLVRFYREKYFGADES